MEMWEQIGVTNKINTHNRWCVGVWVLCSHEEGNKTFPAFSRVYRHLPDCTI